MKAYSRILILMDTDRAFERGLVKGILRYARLYGPFEFMRSESQKLGGLREITLEKIRAWHPDGIFMREGCGIANIDELDLPTIFFPVTEPDQRFVNVLSNGIDIGRLAAQHLVSRGLEHFAFCGLSDNYYWSRERKLGFMAAIEREDFEAVSFDLLGDASNLDDWIKNLPKPVGLMVCTDDCSSEIYDSIHRLELRAPQDIAIVGVDNDEIICEFSAPPLSSLSLNMEDAGFRAAQMLDQMIGGKTDSEDIVIDALDVVERQSSNFLAIADKMVAAALQFISDQRTKPITVDDVVAAVPASRRLLYRRFKEALGRSIAKEIRLARINQAERLLIDTDYSVAEISEQLGFDAPQSFARTFLHEKGVTPSKYRRGNRR